MILHSTGIYTNPDIREAYSWNPYISRAYLYLLRSKINKIETKMKRKSIYLFFITFELVTLQDKL